MDDDAGVLVRNPWVKRRKLTVAEYHLMGDTGILGPEDRVELIEGEVVLMAPVGSGHAGAVNGFNRRLVLAAGERAVVAAQNPIRLDNYNEPQPDFSLLRPRAAFYRHATPRPADVLLVIEVSQSSLRYDRAVKLALYAAHGIPEVWIVDVEAGQVERFHTPEADRYTVSSRLGRQATLEPVLLPGLAISLDGVLG